MSNEWGVRSFRYAIAVIAISGAAALGCSQMTSPVQPTGVALVQNAEVGSVSPLQPTGATLVENTEVGSVSVPALEGYPELGPELAAVRRATALFHQVEHATVAGYLDPIGGHCDESTAGAMGIHSANPALLQSQALDPAQPEVLLYLPKKGGGVRLVGVEYVQTVLLRNPETGVVAPWFAQGPWPPNYIVVTPTPRLFGQTFQGPMPGHLPGMPWHWDLHVWVWANNPSGTFAQWNSALRCDAE